jgi:hypothetical protein
MTGHFHGWRGALGVYGMEAWHELRAGLRSPMVALMFTGLVAYVFQMLLNAEFLRDMGGADVPRNSSLTVYQMTSGQAFWLIFVWAWVFGQVVARDHEARLQEFVLSAPISASGLFVARFAGALGLACILGSSSSFALLLVPLLGALGLFPPAAIGPTPIGAIAHAWLLFVLPSALGLGAIYVLAALRTRSTAGPFAASALIILVWMIAMVVLRGADIQSEIATMIDVSGFGEAEYQTMRWTPAQKAQGILELTAPLLYNRLLWTAVPLALLSLVLARLRRESLVLERGRPHRANDVGCAAPKAAFVALRPVARPSWLAATWSDARWQLSRTVSGWAFIIAMVLWVCLNVAAPFVHMLAHAEGPLVPRGQLLAPFLMDLCYLFTVFGIAGFIGMLVRRDRQPGFSEIIDATPAPLGVRVLASAMAASAVTVVFAFVPALSSWVVMALTISDSIDWASPMLVSGLAAAPALLELGAATFMIHALVRSAGTAHALSMFVAFVAVVNHEVGIVTYPPAQLGIPAHVALSELTGIGPWLSAVAALDGLKLSLATLMGALAWLAHARGTAITVQDRWRAAWQRLRGSAGALAAAALVLCVASAWLLGDRLVTRGGYRSPDERDRDDAAWERRFWEAAGSFTIRGGTADITLEPHAQRARAVLHLVGVHANNGRLGGELPPNARTISARVAGSQRDMRVELDHFELELGACPEFGCDVTLDLEIVADGWGLDHVPPWLHASGVWLRARDVLPRLGLDPDRGLRSPVLRQSHALPERRSAKSGGTFVSAVGVAPAGEWRWTVRVTEAGEHTSLSGDGPDPLDFAMAWLPRGVKLVQAQHGLQLWHGLTREAVAREVAEDVLAMRACVGARTEMPIEVDTVLQAPRGLGSTSLHGRLLWVPEDDGWDVASAGVGRTKRRATIAHALASTALARAAALRTEPGSRWLTTGIAGAVALACVQQLDGTDDWLVWMGRESERVAEALGALDAPIVGLAEDGPAPWVEEYAPLAIWAWWRAQSEPSAAAVVRAIVDRVRAGISVREALHASLGKAPTTRLLGAPSVSDIAVVSRGAEVVVQGTRSRWERGGWHAAPEPVLATQQFCDGASRSAPLPFHSNGDGRFSVFDAEPSFERSPLDNVWPRSSTPTP